MTWVAGRRPIGASEGTFSGGGAQKIVEIIKRLFQRRVAALPHLRARVRAVRNDQRSAEEGAGFMPLRFPVVLSVRRRRALNNEGS